MHDPEKSDSGIVATKPTNKAGPPAAEPAEPRPGTKGNADQQSTHRTQSRVRVTQALDRVREAARRRKKGQFTPHRCRRAPDCVLPAQAQSRPGRGWHDVARLRGGPRTEDRRSAWTGPPGSLSTATVAPDVHTEGRWEAAAARDRRPGRQDRAGRNRHGAQRYL